MEGKLPPESTVTVPAKQNVNRAEEVKQRNERLRKSAAAVKTAAGLEHSTLGQPQLRKMRMAQTGEVTSQGEAMWQVGHQIDTQTQGEEDTVLSDPRFVEPLAVLAKDSAGIKQTGKVGILTAKQIQERVGGKADAAAKPREVANSDVPAYGSSLKDQEFEELTGAKDRQGAFGVAVTPERAARYRYDKWGDAYLRDQRADAAEARFSEPVAGEERYRAEELVRVSRAVDNAFDEVEYYRRLSERSNIPGDHRGEYARHAALLERRAQILEGQELVLERVARDVFGSEQALTEAEVEAGQYSIDKEGPLPSLSDEVTQRLYERNFGKEPPEDVLARLGDVGIVSEIKAAHVKGRLSPKLRLMIGAGVVALTALIRRDALDNGVQARTGSVDTGPFVTAPVGEKFVSPRFPVARNAPTADEGPQYGPEVPAVTETPKAPVVERVNYEVKKGQGLSAILDEVNRGRYKVGDEEFGNQELLQEDMRQFLKINRDRFLDVGDDTWKKDYQDFYDAWDQQVQKLGRELSSSEFNAVMKVQRANGRFGGASEDFPTFEGQSLVVTKYGEAQEFVDLGAIRHGPIKSHDGKYQLSLGAGQSGEYQKLLISGDGGKTLIEVGGGNIADADWSPYDYNDDKLFATLEKADPKSGRFSKLVLYEVKDGKAVAVASAGSSIYRFNQEVDIEGEGKRNLKLITWDNADGKPSAGTTFIFGWTEPNGKAVVAGGKDAEVRVP